MAEDLSGFSMLELFRLEAESQTAILSAGVLAVEELERSPETIESMMRAAHSLKGAARIVGLEPAVRVAHAMEDCFVAAGKGTFQVRPEHVDLLLASIDDPNPVLFLEHRWLHNLADDVPEQPTHGLIGKARVARQGDDITIVASGYLTLEAIRAADYLTGVGIKCDVIDLRTLSPLDWPAIFKSVHKTGRLMAVDSGAFTGSIAGEIIARVASERFADLKVAPRRLAQPDVPEPTSFGLTRGFHVRSASVARCALEMMGETGDVLLGQLPDPVPHDVPGDWFKGPF